jgi:hypothetical protein
MTNQNELVELLPEVVKTLSFFRSVIKGKEEWSNVCENSYDDAMQAIEKVMEFLQSAEKTGYVTLGWDKPMTSAEAEKYWLTGGFVAVELYTAETKRLKAQIAELEAAEEAEPVGIEAAAKWVEDRRDAYIDEHGSYDPDTGQTEFPEYGHEYVEELEEIAEGIRSLCPQPTKVQVPEGYAVVEKVIIPEEAVKVGAAAIRIARDVGASDRTQALAAFTDMLIKADVSDSLPPQTAKVQSAEPVGGCTHSDLFNEANRQAVLNGEPRELHKDCAFCGEVFVLYKEAGVLKIRNRDCTPQPAKVQVPEDAEIRQRFDKLRKWIDENDNWTAGDYTNFLGFYSYGFREALTPSPARAPEVQVPDDWRKPIEDLLAFAERQTCYHEETHRGGHIWEICDACGEKWAADKGGKPESVEPKEIVAVRELLNAAPAQAEKVVSNNITRLERELSLAREIEERDIESFSVSEKPLVEKIFLNSSKKLRKKLESKLYRAKCPRRIEV